MKIYIPKPEGLEPPQGANPEEEFDVSARVKMEDGKLCVMKINGIPVGDKEDEDEESEGLAGKGLMEAARQDNYA